LALGAGHGRGHPHAHDSARAGSDGGRATRAPTRKRFELTARRGSETFGICSGPFIEHAFRTLAFRIGVTIHDDGTWSYEEDTVMMVRGQSEPFHHTDRNILTRIGEPLPNPLARERSTPVKA
jgi:Uncharacterized conserved protein